MPIDSQVSSMEVLDDPLDGEASPPPDVNLDLGRSLQVQIDVKGLVGDSVGNMSISPTSRDVVLAARKGLFIIDLQAPLEIPRFLPQGGTWDVADVQWNPHRSHGKYIVSTSSEKLLIWDLLLVGKTSIEHILHSHYRAITDINWHTSEPDLVVSTGIDSWLWCWDLRDLRNRHKPVFGMCAFNGAGTQVKWNRQDPHLLASSHMNEVLIWDRRKGSMPVETIQAHDAKIYGIDWAHHSPRELVTCSLDRSIKVWDFSTACPVKGTCHPKTTIHTRYPVWRARNLPFGHGILSLPQRGETVLEMYAHDDPRNPIHTFEGHTDVVKEFVWRRGEGEGEEFQLITWSKDRTLRFWPITPDVMQKTGCIPKCAVKRTVKSKVEEDISYRNPPIGNDRSPALSAPVGHRSILAEVRAPLPPRPPYTHRHDHSSGAHERDGSARGNVPSSTTSTPIHITGRAGGTMTRGNLGGRSARMNPLDWLSSVKVEKRRESFSGPGSGVHGGHKSRGSSASTAPLRADLPGSRVVSDQWPRSSSQTRGEEASSPSQSLQDEITAVLTKLASHKIRLEKHDLMKKRTCTLGLHGPWGDSSSYVFIRVTFTFPRAYPQAAHPQGTPTVDLERNPLISMKHRTYILRRLRNIRETKRPCLEACLTFLLSGREVDRENAGVPPAMDSESEDEGARGRGVTVSLVRSNKNLAEPRTSQGVFGPNGELVCFFRAPPRIVRSAIRDVSATPSVASHMQESTSRLPPPAGSVIDAMQRLAAVASDRVAPPVPGGSDNTDNVLRVMTNLLTFTHPRSKQRQDRSKTADSGRGSFSLVSTRLSTVYLKDASHITGVDSVIAAEYVFSGSSPLEVCKRNSEFARKLCRFDDERVFKVLHALMTSKDDTSRSQFSHQHPILSPVSDSILSRLYNQLCQEKDVQMLAFLASVILHVHLSSRPSPSTIGRARVMKFSPALSSASHKASLDYFNARPRSDSRPHTVSSSVSRPRPPSSPATPPGPMVSSSNSSKGSWSSLFYTTGMRNTVLGGQESPQDSGQTGLPSATKMGGHSIPVPVIADKLAQDALRRRAVRHGSPANPSPSNSKSWNDVPLSISRSMSSIPSVGRIRRRTFSQVVRPEVSPAKKSLVFNFEEQSGTNSSTMSDPAMLQQLISHVIVYSEMLFRWGLLQKRAELISSIGGEGIRLHNFQECKEEITFGLRRICPRCGVDDMQPRKSRIHCPNCDARPGKASCAICRLPAEGLSFNCLKCRHAVHIACQSRYEFTTCPTGCGCACAANHKGWHRFAVARLTAQHGLPS